MPRKNKIIVAVLVVLFVCTGFFREFVFLNWNEQIRVSYYNSPDSHLAPSMRWLEGFSYETLYWLKWPLTLFFSVLFMGFSLLVIHFAFPEKKYRRITIFAYCGIFLLSFLFFVAGWLLNSRESTYDIARFLAGIIETPAMLVILAASFMVHRRL